MHKGEVYFRLSGESFDPDSATRRLGIEPSRLGRQAEPKPAFSSWIISSGQITSELIDVYDLSKKLVDILASESNKIATLIAESSLCAVLQVVLWISTDPELSTPAIGFDQGTVDFLAKVGASIDVDTYLQEV